MLRKKVICIDLFCGMGGATQGMIDAGATVILSIDGWIVAKELHEANFPDVPFVQRMLGVDYDADLKIILDALAPYLDDREGVHIHIHGSPPCQAFSTAGLNRTAEGQVNVDWYLALVEDLKSRDLCDSWSMENVPATRKHYPDLPHVMINAAQHGAPQARRRFFAGEGWEITTSDQRTSWNEALGDPTIPVGSVLNMVGAAWSGSKRAASSDAPWGEPSRTITRQNPTIRRQLPSGDFERVRLLTFDEIAILNGFPSGLIRDTPSANKRDISLALGNCVCPPAMTAVIEGIVDKGAITQQSP